MTKPNAHFIPIKKVPDPNDILMDTLDAAFQALSCKVFTGPESMPISYMGE